MTTEPIVSWRLDCLLGEGPVWVASEQALRFVDIKRGRLHRYDPASRAGDTLEIGGQPSFIVAAEEGLLVGNGHMIALLDGCELGETVALLDEPMQNRTNDATVDPTGRLWFGTMDDTERAASGAVWCLDRGTLHRAGAEAIVTNGPAISPDGRWLYLADGELLVEFNPSDGHPDGVVVDSEGCLWIALWDGWAVRRYAPDGDLLLQIDFPCARVTKLAFGGADMKTAFVTTARVGLSDRELARQPHAGSLFTFESSVAGVALPPVRLAAHA
jgi:xylono-1,5-lactonase